MGKYSPLRDFLKRRGADTVPMTFAEIEKVLGFKLPNSKNYPAWWSNNPTNNVMTNEWLAAGYKTEQVDVEGRKLVFRRSERRSAAAAPKSMRGRHPLIGAMKGMMTIAPGVDLTAPADPDWGDIAWGDEKRK